MATLKSQAPSSLSDTDAPSLLHRGRLKDIPQGARVSIVLSFPLFVLLYCWESLHVEVVFVDFNAR